MHVDDNSFLSRCPLVRAEEMTRLARVVDLDGRGGRGAAYFVQPVSWLREGEAMVVLRHANGEDLKTSPLYNDHYGFLTCVGGLAAEARAWAERYQAGPDAILEVAVVCTVKDVPVQAAERRQEAPHGMRYYVLTPDDWILRDDDAVIEDWASAGLGRRTELLPRIRFLRPRVLAGAAVVWSSRVAADAEAERALRERFLDVALDGLDGWRDQARAAMA